MSRELCHLGHTYLCALSCTVEFSKICAKEIDEFLVLFVPLIQYEIYLAEN